MLTTFVPLTERALRWLQALGHVLDLAIRLYVAEVFFRSGILKITRWDSTLYLFSNEYHVPLLPPHVAAVLGTFGELFFPALLILGLFTRVAALGLFAVNLLAVVSYWHVLGQDGYEAALAQHVLWGYMLAVVLLCGAGALSLDHLLEKRAGRAGSAPLTN